MERKAAVIELEKFSEAARRAVTLGDYEARYVVTGAIEPGHLLFGVVQEAPDWAAALSAGRLTPEGVRRRLKQEYAARLQLGPWASEEMKLSAAAQAALTAAQELAAARGQAVVGLAHLLLALLASNDVATLALLDEAGLTREQLEAAAAGDAPPAAPATLER
jgi:ATP-dependent Clp protease ATP-binding subunit ClpA